jgi:hypothetical protein
MTTNRIMPAAATFALAVCLSGCILITWFQKDPAPTSSQSVTRMGDTVYRIDLQGLESTGRHEMTSNLLKRAAEVTLEAGYDYFIVSGGEVREESELQARPAARTFLESPSGSLVDSSARVSQRYFGAVLFHVFQGEKPPDNPLAFDAHSLSP